MLKRNRIMIGVAFFAAAVAIPISGVLAAPPTSPFTALTLDGSGDNPVLGSAHSVSFGGSGVSLANADGGVTVSATGYSVNLLPPTGGALAVGGAAATKTTPDASDYGLTVTANGTACVTGAGSVTIKQLTVSGGNVTVLAASFSTTCGTSTAPVAGEIRFKSTTGYLGATQNKTAVDFGSADTGFATAAQTVTFTSVGSDPIVFGKAAISGGDADSFAISGDTCSNKSVAGTSTCTVSIVAKPINTGAAAAALTIPDNTGLGARTVALSVNGHVGPEGTYHALAPARLLDTRNGTGAAKHVVGPNGTIHLQVSGQGGVPASGASAVQLNVTEISATKSGYLTVFPTGVTKPNSSNLNYTAGVTQANAVTVALGTNGQVDIFNNGTSDLSADVSGYFVGSDSLAAGGQYNPVEPTRLLDSRDLGPLGYGGGAAAGISFGNDVDPHITALVVNITAVSPAAAGYFTALERRRHRSERVDAELPEGPDGAEHGDRSEHPVHHAVRREELRSRSDRRAVRRSRELRPRQRQHSD